MATYSEIYSLRNDSNLKNKVVVACIVAAETIMAESTETINHINRLLWAKAVFANPNSEAARMLMAVLAANDDQTVATIQGADDSIVQANVDAHIDLFADGS